MVDAMVRRRTSGTLCGGTKPVFDLLFAVFRGDKEGLFEDGNGEMTVGVLVAGGDAHLGDGTFVTGQIDSLLFGDEFGGGGVGFGGKRDLDHEESVAGQHNKSTADSRGLGTGTRIEPCLSAKSAVHPKAGLGGYTVFWAFAYGYSFR